MPGNIKGSLLIKAINFRQGVAFLKSNSVNESIYTSWLPVMKTGS